MLLLLAIIALAQLATVGLLWRARPRPATSAKPPGSHHWDSDVLDSRIETAVTEHSKYESDRIERRGEDHAFMHDQRLRAICQRVERAYFAAREKPPADLDRRIKAYVAEHFPWSGE